jgi:hypothetical protein
MGAVFLGRDPAGGLVAVKVIRAEHARDENFRARFRSEVNRAREVPGRGGHQPSHACAGDGGHAGVHAWS